MANRITPGQAVVQSLKAHGVDMVFGLDGSHVIQVFDALHDAPEIRPITVKHENNASIAAEVYGRLTGRPGVVLVTAGPGATNSLSGVAGAYAAGAPMVHISGGVPVGAAREAFHGVDVEDFLHRAFEPVTKASVRVDRAADIASALARAFALAVAGRPGPVHVEIAESALNEPSVDLAGVALTADANVGTSAVPRIEDLAARVDRADRVAIVAGKGAWWPVVSRQVVALAERIGAPVAHTWDGHAAMPTTHPLSSAVWWGEARSHPVAAELVDQADVVLGIGVRPGTESEVLLRKAVGERLVIVDAADAAEGSGDVFASSVEALASTLDRLTKACEPRPTRAETLDRCAYARSIQQRGLEIELARYRDSRPWHIGAALDVLARRMTPDMLVISDVSNVKLWTPLQVPTYSPESHLQSGSWGAMGYAVPAVLAAGLVRPEKKVIGLAGDTSFLMGSSDFSTICQLGLPVVLAVHNDGRIGMIDNMLTQAYGRAYATDMGKYDLVKYAESFGARGISVSEPAGLEAAWEEALGANETVLLELKAGHDFPWPWPVKRLVEQAQA
ncbi:MAG: thiamine pyrophosphate-binding protein [Chloroflexota bacterium]